MRRLAQLIRQLFCSHKGAMDKMPVRTDSGFKWPCDKCGKGDVFWECYKKPEIKP